MSYVTGAALNLQGDVGVLDSGGNPCTNGGTVTTWQDQSGNGKHAVTNGTALPTFTASFLKGLGGVLFPNTNTGLSTGLALSSPYTIYVVEKNLGFGGNHRTINNKGASNSEFSGVRDDGYTVFIGGVVSTAHVTSAAGHILRLRVGAPAAAGYFASGASYLIDNVNQTTDATPTGGFENLSIGSTPDFLETAATTVCAVLAYSTALNDADDAQNYTELYNKWLAPFKAIYGSTATQVAN